MDPAVCFPNTHGVTRCNFQNKILLTDKSPRKVRGLALPTNPISLRSLFGYQENPLLAGMWLGLQPA